MKPFNKHKPQHSAKRMVKYFNKGGTLHHATPKQWLNAPYENRVATSASMLWVMKKMHPQAVTYTIPKDAIDAIHAGVRIEAAMTAAIEPGEEVYIPRLFYGVFIQLGLLDSGVMSRSPVGK